MDGTSTRLHRNVWALGLVSLLMDASSEIVHAIVPLLLTLSFGVSAAVFGVIEGIAEGLSPLVKAMSGAWSDRMTRRKPLVLAGYGLAALTKPVFALAAGPYSIAAARIADRMGKGLRGAPRDALIADVTPKGVQGRAFGLRQSLDTLGAIIGPAAAALMLMVFAGDLRLALWIAVIPAVLSVVVLMTAVREAPRAQPPESPSIGARFRDLPWPVRRMAGLAAIALLARYSDGFFIIAGLETGLPVAASPLPLVAMNIAYAAIAYPAGRWQDRNGPRGPLLAGLAALVLANLCMALTDNMAGVFAAAVFFGLHMGLTQGVFAAMIGSAAPPELKGTAFGLYHGLTGLALFVASAGGGLIWHAAGSDAMFAVSAGLTLLALALFAHQSFSRPRT